MQYTKQALLFSNIHGSRNKQFDEFEGRASFDPPTNLVIFDLGAIWVQAKLFKDVSTLRERLVLHEAERVGNAIRRVSNAIVMCDANFGGLGEKTLVGIQIGTVTSAA